ncbi:MAG: hypothetical protein J6P29_05845 [Acetobacter sp.]|nr:hypothetical protein [Acetobacter sp.]
MTEQDNKHFGQIWTNALNNQRNNIINDLNEKGSMVKEKIKNALFKVYAWKMAAFIDDWFADAFDDVIDTEENITFCDIPLKNFMSSPSANVLQALWTHMAQSRIKDANTIDDALKSQYEEAARLIKDINRNYQACSDSLKLLVSVDTLEIVVMDEEHRQAKWVERKEDFSTISALYHDRLKVIEEEVDAFIEEIVPNARKRYEASKED